MERRSVSRSSLGSVRIAASGKWLLCRHPRLPVQGDFYRTFTIGETIDSQKISADLKNGVVTLHLAKTEAVKPRRIAVKS